MAVGVSFGANSGYAINPARDFGPRLLAYAAGWGKVAMPGDYVNISTYFWIPIVGPLVGAAIASFVYDLGIKDILMARRAPEPGVEAEGRTVQDRPAGTAETGVRGTGETVQDRPPFSEQ
jgi:glycerol uptake facilitator protein